MSPALCRWLTPFTCETQVWLDFIPADLGQIRSDLWITHGICEIQKCNNIAPLLSRFWISQHFPQQNTYKIQKCDNIALMLSHFWILWIPWVICGSDLIWPGSTGTSSSQIQTYFPQIQTRTHGQPWLYPYTDNVLSPPNHLHFLHHLHQSILPVNGFLPIPKSCLCSAHLVLYFLLQLFAS